MMQMVVKSREELLELVGTIPIGDSFIRYKGCNFNIKMLEEAGNEVRPNTNRYDSEYKYESIGYDGIHWIWHEDWVTNVKKIYLGGE